MDWTTLKPCEYDSSSNVLLSVSFPAYSRLSAWSGEDFALHNACQWSLGPAQVSGLKAGYQCSAPPKLINYVEKQVNISLGEMSCWRMWLLMFLTLI